VLGRDVLVLEAPRLLEGLVEHVLELAPDVCVAPTHLRQSRQLPIQPLAHRPRTLSRALEQGRHDATLLYQQRLEQVQAGHLLVIAPARRRLGRSQGISGLRGQSVQSHLHRRHSPERISRSTSMT
jgi:hypothetical protein